MRPRAWSFSRSPGRKVLGTEIRKCPSWVASGQAVAGHREAAHQRVVDVGLIQGSDMAWSKASARGPCCEISSAMALDVPSPRGARGLLALLEESDLMVRPGRRLKKLLTKPGDLQERLRSLDRGLSHQVHDVFRTLRGDGWKRDQWQYGTVKPPLPRPWGQGAMGLYREGSRKESHDSPGACHGHAAPGWRPAPGAPADRAEAPHI